MPFAADRSHLQLVTLDPVHPARARRHRRPWVTLGAIIRALLAAALAAWATSR